MDAEAHRRAPKIIIDFVPDHSSDPHPWFVESRSPRDNPKRDGYVWVDCQPIDGVPEAFYVFLRQAEDQRFLVAPNFSGEEQQVSVPALGAGTVAVSTYLDRMEAVAREGLILRGDEGVIVELSGQQGRISINL